MCCALILVWLLTPSWLRASGLGFQEPEKEQQPEMSVRDLDRLGVPAPENLQASLEKRKITVTWDTSPLKRVVKYEVYRKMGNSPFKLIRTVPKPPFVDRLRGKQNIEYVVAAVDYRGNRSSLSPPVMVKLK
jgi:hypothetical protein